MVQPQRIIYLVLVIGWAIFRLVRYLRVSAAKHMPPAVPASGDSPVPLRSDTGAATAMSATPSPIEPAGDGGAGLARNLVAAAVFIATAAATWSLLFMVPAFEGVPPLVRMITGVLVTLYLIQLARGVAARLTGAGQGGDTRDNDPIK